MLLTQSVLKFHSKLYSLCIQSKAEEAKSNWGCAWRESRGARNGPERATTATLKQFAHVSYLQGEGEGRGDRRVAKLGETIRHRSWQLGETNGSQAASAFSFSPSPLPPLSTPLHLPLSFDRPFLRPSLNWQHQCAVCGCESIAEKGKGIWVFSPCKIFAKEKKLSKSAN